MVEIELVKPSQPRGAVIKGICVKIVGCGKYYKLPAAEKQFFKFEINNHE